MLIKVWGMCSLYFAPFCIFQCLLFVNRHFENLVQLCKPCKESEQGKPSSHSQSSFLTHYARYFLTLKFSEFFLNFRILSGCQNCNYRTRAKISNAYSKLTRFLDALIFEHFQNLSYILANFNVFKACLWLKYTFKIYFYALVSTILSKK